jgi:hypothetical protein
LEFGEILTAVGLLAVIDTVLGFVLLAVFIPTAGSYVAPDIAGIVALLLAGLIVGYVFGGKIREARMRSIGRIAVFFAVVFMFATLALFTNPYAGAAMKEGLESMYSTSGWATWDWVAYSQMMMVMLVALNVIYALVFTVIGLYVGSKLKK